MAGKKFALPFLFLILASQGDSASLYETSYEYVMSFGKSIAPSLMSIWDCMKEEEAWSCAKEKAGKILDGWSEKVDNERRSWREAADAEVASTGRSFEEMPSKIAEDVENSFASLSEVFYNGVARALESRKHGGGGIDSVTISAGSDKKKMKKKQKPPKIHLIHPVMMPLRKAHKEEKGRGFPNGRQTWVIGHGVPMGVDVEASEHVHDDAGLETEMGVERGAYDNREGRDLEASEHVESDAELEVERGVKKGVNQNREGRSIEASEIENDVLERGVERGAARGVLADLWSISSEALDILADTALEAENKDNGVQVKSSFEEQRGKKKKKKKAILKLLILGAVLKAKIGTLLQILSFKLQVKFFILALLGLAINLARLLIDLKKKHQTQPQKVIYYEHAQHQHHYDHEEEHESPGWGPWSRSMEPEETDVQLDVDLQNSPYRGQIRNPHPYPRPVA